MRRCRTRPLTVPLGIKSPFGFLSRNSWVFAQKYRFDPVSDKNFNCFETGSKSRVDQKSPGHVTYTIIWLFRRMTQPGPSLTIWDREGNFKECKRKPEDFTSGLSFYLKRLPGRRFALIQKTAFGHGALFYEIYI